MSKRKVLNSVLTIDQVINNLNAWFVDEDCDVYEVEDHLDYLYGELNEENENNSDLTEQFFLEDEVIESIDDEEEQPLNTTKRYAPRKQLTRNHKVYDIDSSLDEPNFEKIII